VHEIPLPCVRYDWTFRLLGTSEADEPGKPRGSSPTLKQGAQNGEIKIKFDPGSDVSHRIWADETGGGLTSAGQWKLIRSSRHDLILLCLLFNVHLGNISLYLMYVIRINVMNIISAKKKEKVYAARLSIYIKHFQILIIIIHLLCCKETLLHKFLSSYYIFSTI